MIIMPHIYIYYKHNMYVVWITDCYYYNIIIIIITLTFTLTESESQKIA